MTEPASVARRQPLAGLATKIIFLVSVSTFMTAVVVSWISVQSTHTFLRRRMHLAYPTLLASAAEEIRGRVAAGEPLAAARLRDVAQRLGPGAQIFALDRNGRFQLPARPGAVPRAALPPSSAPEIHEYRNHAGRHVVGARLVLDELGLVLVLEQPFEEAFGPVLSVVTRVFVIDLCIILLFSFLAYQITATIVRPIEALSEGARKISAGELGVTLPDQKSQDEIGLLTRAFNEMTRKLRAHRGEIEEAQRRLVQDKEELQRANEMLEQLSITDGLTRLHNHRFFQDHLTREIKRVNRTGEPLAMLLIDIDDFKRLNDRLGHAAGDALLTGIAQVMNESVRDSDLLARYGGEEFVVVASGTDLAGAMRLAEKLRAAVAEASFLVDEAQPRARCTISMGVAAYKGNRKSFFQAADRALYRAKAEGKNRVVCADG